MTADRQGRATPLRDGDLLEASLRDGRLAYLQQVFRMPPATGGSVFRVLAGRYRSRPPDLPALVARPEEYRVWWVGEALIEQGLATVVGRFPLPEDSGSAPQQWFRAYRPASASAPADWLLYAQAAPDVRSSMHAVPELTAEQRRLPILYLGPADDLQATLEHSSDGALAPEELNERGLVAPQRPALTLEHPVNHFLIFRSERNADAAAQAASGIGDQRMVVRPPGSPDWLLVVGTNRRAQAELSEDARLLGRLARRHRGVYDGHEVAPAG